MLKRSFLTFLMTFTVGFSALAGVKVCNIRVVDEQAKKTKGYCQAVLYTEDQTGAPGPGSINRQYRMGTVYSNCTGLMPAKFSLYDQGFLNPQTLKDSFTFLANQTHYGVIGVNPMNVVSAKWYAGGEGAFLVHYFEYYDSSSRSLGTMFTVSMSKPGMVPMGCYLQ